jgi:hypothetical protein
VKKFFKFGCFGFIGLIVLIIIIAVATSDSSDETGQTDTGTNETSSSTEEKDAPKEEPKEKITGIGEVLQVGDVEFKVNGTSTAKNVGGEFGQDAQGTFLLVDVTIANKGTEAITVDSSFFKLNADGKTYESDSTAGVYANENASFFLEQVNPDLSLTGTVVFDLSDEVIANPDLLLNVQTGLFGTEQGQIKIAK